MEQTKVKDIVRTEMVVEDRSKIRIDIGCGQAKQKGFVGMDIRRMPGVDVVHDIESYPWPFPDSCASIINASHIIEHIPPVSYRLEVTRGTPPLTAYGVITDVKLHREKGLLLFMDEMHRVLENEGQAWITCPYGWSHGFVQDPTHTKPINESFFEYFTPRSPNGAISQLYGIYTPRPWGWVRMEYDQGGNMIAVLEALKDEKP